MDFDKEVIITRKDVDPLERFDGTCPFCGSSTVITHSSRIREVPDLGTTMEQVIARIKEPRMLCQECSKEFVLHHPFYPPKYEYSKAVVEHALTLFHYMNVSGKQIALKLKTLHQVEVSEATIYSWLKTLSPAFLKPRLEENQEKTLEQVKTISIDGSYVNLGKAIIGKKKHADSLSVTKLKNGHYLLMWWE